jgi:hypothetical protein
MCPLWVSKLFPTVLFRKLQSSLDIPCICDVIPVKYTASSTASATFGHSASPDTVTYWHIMALQ